MSYLARPGTLSDLATGVEILYFAGGEYVPGTVYHGIVLTVHAQAYGVGTTWVPVLLDSGNLPVRIFSTRPLWIIGS